MVLRVHLTLTTGVQIVSVDAMNQLAVFHMCHTVGEHQEQPIPAMSVITDIEAVKVL
jgi:hypothetical protein